MADFGGSDPPPDRNGGKGREEIKKNGSGGEGMSRTEVFLPPDIGASGSSFVQKSSQQVKDESSELTGSKSGDPGAKSIQNPNTGMKNKNQNRQMNREQMGHGGKKPESYIAAIAQNFTGDTTGQKIGIHKTEKPQKHQTAESNEPESHLNKEDTKAKAASNKQESFRPESEDGRGTRGSRTVRMGTKNNQEHLHREQRPEKIYSKQNREGIDGHEVKVSHISVTGKQSDKGEHGSLLSGSFCVIRDEDIPIVVKTNTGKEITINVGLSDTIEKVKEKIEDINDVDKHKVVIDGQMAKSSNINTCPLQDNRGSPNEKKEGGKKVEEQPADSRSLTALKSEITEKHQDFSRKDNVDNAASIGKLVECNEHKADDKDKDDLKDKKENMQPTDLASVTHEGSVQKTAEDKGGTKHDDSAGHENGSKDSKTSGKPKVEAASADTCVNKVEPSDESIEKDDDYPRHFKNNLSDVEEKTEEHIGEESQRTDDDTQPESGSPLSRSSSIENIAEEDQGENVDESYCSVEFEMKSITHSQNDCRKELKYDTESDKQNGKALTDVFNKAKTQDIEDEDENRQDTHRFNNKESGKSEPIEDSSVPYRYTLREVDNEYVLLVNNTIPVKVPELNGKSNVSVKEDFILINGKLEYLIKNEGGKIILTKLEEAQVGDVSKEIQKLSPSPVARHDHGEEEIMSDSKVRTAKATKIRASTPQMDELMKTEDDEKSQTDKCSQPVASINTDNSHNISVEGEEKDLEMVTNLMRGVKIEDPMTEEQRQEHNNRQPFDTSKVVKTDECKPKAAPRKKHQEKPVMITVPLPKTIESQVGKEVTFKCQVSKLGVEAEWTVGGQPVKDDGRFESQSTGMTHILVVKNVDMKDVGEYVVRIGDRESRCYLQVYDNKPSAPKNLTTSDITSESCHLHWQKPDHENGSPITKYIVQICKSGEKDWKEAGSSTTTDTVVHGLQRQTQYLFRVAAENEVGIGAFGELPAHKTTEDSSEWKYHDENTAKAKCGDSIVLKVPFKGAKPSVSLLHNDGPVQNMERVKAEIIDSCVCCRLQEVDLADQGKYTLTVENDTGRGTVVANLIVLERLPAPRNLTANWTTPVSCQVNWQEPVDLVGSKIKVYVVEMYLKEGKHYSTPNSYQCDTTFLNIKDLDSNNQYLFRVAAKNEVGIGEFTALQGLKTVKNSDGNEDSQLFIPVRVHIGGENECIDAVFKSSSEYLKWMFVIQNNEAAKQLSSPETKQPSRSEVVVENGEIAVTLSHKSDRKQKVEAVNDCLQTSINKLTDILVACFEGNGNESKISEIIEQSELVKEHNLYIHFDKRLQKIYLVCFVNLVEHVDKEFRQALVKVKSDFKGHFGIDLEYQYESKISFSNVEEAITSKFPEVHFEYTADYRKRSCICYLQGQSIVELEKAKQFVQQEVGRFTYNSFSFSEIKNIHAIDDELAVEYLNMEIKGMCEASSFEGLHIEVDSEEKRVVIAGCKQTDVDNLASKVKSCISHKSFQLQASEKSQKEFLSNMVSKFHGRIFGSFREGNCHCYGSSEVMKMIQEHIAKQEGEKKNPCKEILDEVSSDLKMQTKINRFAVIKKFDTFHFIKDKVDMEDLKLGSDVSVIIKETSDKFGFLIQGTEESIVNLENTIHIVESQVQEKEMSVKVLNGQMEIYEACTREIERDCNVLIKKLQETDFPCESVPQRKQWAFVGGQTLIISCDSAQKQWKDLFVELKQVRQIDKELKPQLKKNGNRKVTELFIPTYSKDEDAGKQKHFLQDSTEKVLKQALHCQCTHICIPVEELYGWPLEKFVKQIFHVVIEQFKHISNKLPMVIELCLPKKEDFMECCDIAANAMPETVSELSDDSETDESVHSDGKGISVVIENGKLDETEADVIVNTTAPDLKLRNGVVSKSIHDSAGKEIQDECFKKYHRNLDNGEIVITKGYKLKCKHVFHGALQAYDRRKDEHSLQHIEKFITDCLWKANFLGHKSIAFPVIGTGRLEYPAHRIADALFKGVKSFEKECTSAMTIQLVKVVIFKDSEVVKVFESKKIKYEKEDDKIVKQEVDHLTSRKMQCSGVTINAEMASSAAACGMAEALVVFFDNTSVPTLKTSQLLKYMGNSAASEFSANRNAKKPFATKPGNLSNNTVIHVPVKNTQNSLKEGFQRGLRLADSKMIYSAAVYFDAKESPYLVHGKNIAKEFVEAVKEIAKTFKHLSRVTLVIGGLVNSSKYFEVFDKGCREDADNILTGTSILVKIIGYKAGVEKAELRLTNWGLSKQYEVCKEAMSTMVQGAEAAFTEPELQSMDRTCSLEPEADTRTDEKEKVLMRNLPGYVKICHVPENYTFDKLSGELLRANLPVPFERLIFLDGMQEALLICKTSKDAQQLSKFSGDTSFSFFCGEEQPLGNFTLTLKNEDLEKLRRKKNFRNFQDGLNKLHIKFDMGGTLEVKVKTFYQLTCIDKLMKMLLHTDPENTGSRFVMTSGEDDFEHILEAAVTIEGATDRIWQIMLVEKANKIKEFRETCGTISHSEDVLTIKRREITAGDSTFDDFVTVFKSFVEGMKPMEFEDIPVDDEFVDKIPTWQEEIENTLNKHCCTFIQEQKKVIAYFDSYEKAKQVEHLFLVKLGKRKQTARRRQVVATTKDGPESLQSEYVSSSVTKKADFEWSRDAKSCATFKTTEGIQVYVYKANILKLPVDCIVNAANDTLQHGGGVAQVIARGAGQELTDEGNRYIRKKHKIPVGQVVSTTAGKLPYSYVIHAVGPRWSDYAPHYDNDVQRCENDLFSALYNSFIEADKKGLQTIALPAISAAIFAVPIDLCVSQYVEAAIHYSLKESSRTNIKEIHFIDINPRIVRAIQSEFETVLVQAKVSPYDRQKHVQLPRGYRHRSPKTNNEASCQNFKFQNNGRRTHNQSVYEKKGADLMKDVSFSPGEVTMYSEGDKRVYLLGGTEEHRLFVYTSDIVKVKDSAIVVPLDEYRMVGEIGKAVNGAIDKNVQTNYRRAVEDLLPVGSATGTVAITKGFGSGFTRIIHIVFPYREREQDIMYRRKTLIAAFQNIFLEAMKEKDVKKVATTIFGIDDKKKEEVEFGANAFLEGYQHFLNVMRQSGNLKLEVHLVLRNGQYIERVRSTFDTFVQRQQEAQQNISAARGMKDSASEYHPEPMETGDENVEDCVICMDEMNKPRTLQCGHKFCVSCIERHFEIKKTCPTCGAVCGIITGDQPEGYMHWNYNSTHCAGYPNCGQISITYTFPTGRQGPNHPNPGSWYKGITRTAFLPDNHEGRKILQMLDTAFKRKLVFTIGRSRTTGQEGVITWNDIHHKTDHRPNTQFGYPDPTYLTRVKAELADKGVTEEDIPKFHTS